MFSETTFFWPESRVVIILGSPGAGKSELLHKYAERYGVQLLDASLFQHLDPVPNSDALVVDALDEVARIDAQGVSRVIARAITSQASRVVLSSRSAEWDEARTKFIANATGEDPVIAHLDEFSRGEQERLLNAYNPEIDLAAFFDEIDRNDLGETLGNPQFLKLLADSFVEGGQFFSSKGSIYTDAVRRLVKERSDVHSRQTRPTRDQLIASSGEVFAKLLISGASGVSTAVDEDHRLFPSLGELLGDSTTTPQDILDTRIFSSDTHPNHHSPSHRIVAEFCAACYLAERLRVPEKRLSIRRLLALIAPNGYVRDELRGLIGWLAAYAEPSVQRDLIDLDPYATVSNGDPSLLSSGNRRHLLRALQDEADEDPFFRRGDRWRRFNVKNFFTNETLAELRSILTAKTENGHLLDLVLELLQGSTTVELVAGELRQILHDPAHGRYIRERAFECLAGWSGYDFDDDREALLLEASETSLFIVAEDLHRQADWEQNQDTLLRIFRAVVPLCQRKSERRDSDISSLYFVRRLIGEIPPSIIGIVLDQFCTEIICTCGAEKVYRCHCRDGASNLAGDLLDAFFKNPDGELDPTRVWRWLKPLNFHNVRTGRDHESVRYLQSNDELRRAIQSEAMGETRTAEELSELLRHSFNWERHSGINFQSSDCLYFLEKAFSEDNVEIWEHFYRSHNVYGDDKKPSDFRGRLRAQANEKPTFMSAFKRRERMWRQFHREDQRTRRRFRISRNRRVRRQNEILRHNSEHYYANIEEIRRGGHIGWLYRFAEIYLFDYEDLRDDFIDIEVIKMALRSFISQFDDNVPTLEELADCHAEGSTYKIEPVLHAACLLIYRDTGSIDTIPHDVLLAIKPKVGVHWSESTRKDSEALEAEIDRLLFQGEADALDYATRYIERQVANPACKNPDVYTLRAQPQFAFLLPEWPMRWLSEIPHLSLNTMDSSFSMALKHGDRDRLQTVIDARCDALHGQTDVTDEDRATRTFWYCRRFYFRPEIHEDEFAYLTAEKEDLLAFEEISGRLNRGDSLGWPPLSAEKIYRLYSRYIDDWPAVPLPNSWGSGSPVGEKAYRFLSEIIWQMGEDDPAETVRVADRMLADARLAQFPDALRNIRAVAKRKLALQGFVAPTPLEVCKLLDGDKVASVEDLRALLLDELENYQAEIVGSEFDPIKHFYNGDKRVTEPDAAQTIAEWLNLRLKPTGVRVAIEDQQRRSTRCDLTASCRLSGSRVLLPIEVKGQWHKDLFTAAENQLAAHYAINPDADGQGIYLALWFGDDEKVANQKTHGLQSAAELRDAIVAKIPDQLRGMLDVFVLDVSRE